MAETRTQEAIITTNRAAAEQASSSIPPGIDAPPPPKGLMRLEAITDRPQSTRRTSRKHVVALTQSIAAVGLIQPIAVNAQGTLLAGGHRLAALQLLKDEQPEVFAQLFEDGYVPVRIIELESGDPGARKAFEIEMSENEKRRDYTGKEIGGLVARLKEAGYITTTGGPRKKGETQRHLTEALAMVLGKSRRQAQRLLSASEPTTSPTAKESAAARCLRAMDQVLAAAAQEGSLPEVAQMLTEAVQKKSRGLKQTAEKVRKSAAQAV